MDDIATNDSIRDIFVKAFQLSDLSIDKITYKDSHGKKFYAIDDGSYILIEKGKAIIYGAAYLIADGGIQQICEEGKI